MVFYGEYIVSVTEGGRIVIPKKIRENLKGDSFILTKGFNECLAGYDLEDWNSRSKELLKVSLLEDEHIDRRRFLFSGAAYLSIDEQGRIVIPKSLMQYATGDNDSIVIVGVGDHFEIWSQQKWTMYLKKMKK